MDMADSRTDSDVHRFHFDACAPRLVGATWPLLLISRRDSSDVVTIVYLPRQIAQAITMGSLLSALGLALVLNPRIRLRPHRSLMQQMFGVGLANRLFNGLLIDNSWLSIYNDQRFVGGLGDASPYLLRPVVTTSLLTRGAPAAAVSAVMARTPG